MKRLSLLIALFTLQFHTFITAQSAPTSPADLAWIDRTMERYMTENDIPALAAGIVLDGRVETVISKGVLKRGSEEKVNEHTLFQLASLSKSFTGMLANYLAAEGKLDITAPITRYLPPDVNAAARRQLAHITLRDILHHRTGLPRDAPSIQPTPNGRPLTRAYTEAELIHDLNNLKLETREEPRFSYSNFGFGLAGYILERASGQSYETLLQYYIAEAMGMANTTTALNAQQQAQLATPYLPHKRQRETQAWVFGKMAPAGGLYSTVSDLCQLMIQQMEAQRQYERTGTACPLVLNHDKAPMGASDHSFYGYGVMETRNAVDTAITHLGHGGDVDGFVSNYSFAPRQGVGLVMLSSSGGTWFWELERIINMKLLGLPVREAITLDRKILKRYVGKYDFGHLVLTISRKGDQLWTQTPGFPRQKLYPEAENKFFYHAFDGQTVFELDETEEIEKVIYTQDGRTAYPRKVK